MSSSQLKIDALIGSVSLDPAASRGLSNLGDAISSGFNQAKSAMAAHTASAMQGQQKLSEIVRAQNKQYIDNERQKLLLHHEFQQEILKTVKDRDQLEREYGQAGIDALNEYFKTYSNYSKIQREQIEKNSGINLRDFELNKQKLQQLGIEKEHCIEQTKCLQEQSDIIDENQEAYEEINKHLKGALDLFNKQIPLQERINHLYRDMMADELFPKLVGHIKTLVNMQEDFATANYRATGSINEHVSAVNSLNRANGMGIEVNKKAYQEVINMGLQYGSSREELSKLADMHVMTGRVMGVSTEQLAKTTKTFTGLGASIEKVDSIYTNFMIAQRTYGISSAKMNDILNKTNESSLALMGTYGGGAKAAESYANALTVIEGKYGTQAGYHPVVAQGLASILDKMKEATVVGGSMMAMFAFKSGETDPAKRTEAAINKMMEKMPGIKKAFSDSTAVDPKDIEKRKVLQETYMSITGLKREELTAVANIYEKGKENFSIAEMEKEVQEKKLAGMTKEQLIQESMNTAVKNMSTAFQRLVSSIEPIVTPILTVIDKVAGVIGWIAKTFPGFVQAIAFTAIISGVLKFAKNLGKGLQFISGIASKTKETSQNLGGVADKTKQVADNLERAARAGFGIDGMPDSGMPSGRVKRTKAERQSQALEKLGKGRGKGGKLSFGQQIGRKFTKAGGIKGIGKSLGGAAKGFLKSGLGFGMIASVGSSLLDKGAEAADKAGNTGLGTAAAVGSGALSGAATGAMIGSIIPGVGTVIGGAIGGLWGGISGYFDRKAKEEEKAKKIEEANKKAAEKKEASKKITQIEAKRKDRFDLLAEQYGVDKETAKLIAYGKVAPEEMAKIKAKKKEQDKAKQADDALKKMAEQHPKKTEEQLKKMTEGEKLKNEAIRTALVSTQNESAKQSDQSKAMKTAVATASAASVDALNKAASTAATNASNVTKDASKTLGEVATATATNTANVTKDVTKSAATVAASSANTVEASQESIFHKMIKYSPIGLAFTGVSSMFSIGKDMMSETMNITKSFMGGGGIFSIFSDLFGSSSKDKNELIKEAAKEIVSTLKMIHESQKAENKSIKDILASISDNTESKASSNVGIATIWR